MLRYSWFGPDGPIDVAIVAGVRVVGWRWKRGENDDSEQSSKSSFWVILSFVMLYFVREVFTGKTGEKYGTNLVVAV